MKLVSAHQPAFLPWVGLIHKLILSDEFVFMDIAKFRKRAFMHRNYIEINKNKSLLGLNLSKDTDFLTCDKIKISKFHKECLDDIKNKIINTYKNYDYFDDLKEFLSNCLNKEKDDLNTICLDQLNFLTDKLDIKTNIVKESQILDIKKKRSPSERLLEHALKTDARVYITGVNSVEYLEKNIFTEKNIFNYIQDFNYKPFYKYQFSSDPLSIIHQISKIGYKKLKQLIYDTQVKKEDIIKIYDRS